MSNLIKQRNKSSNGKVRKVYVIGGPGLILELQEVGLQCIGGDEHAHKFFSPQDNAMDAVDPEVDVVVVGFDSHFNYYKMAYAAQCIMNGAVFVCTNKDSQFPSFGQLLPANGCFVRAVEEASGRIADVVTGKPNTIGMQMILDSANIHPSKVLMIGDRYDTDIEFGNLAGTDTLLVFSGCTSREEAATISNKNQQPTFVADSIDVLNVPLANSGSFEPRN
eukprot:c7175_g1_i2.p1 GENE.c7175_g1_i2~~c7175_g1_i2.p1  ORF type:complete len:221 (+),score=63.60 c7175_g1_i2:393-1055(+)